MKIAVVRETAAGEARVALTPSTIAPLLGQGHQVLVEEGAGVAAGFTDEQYADAGASLAKDAVAGADAVVSVQPLDYLRARSLRRGAVTISFLPAGEHTRVTALRDGGQTALSLDLVPRTAAGQPFDAQTSQAQVVGYRGAVVAAGMLRRFFPHSITAAGAVPAAKVLVLGAGVAGLTAIGTARRLGAQVEAFDVRPGSAEEIASVGGVPLDLGFEGLAGDAAQTRELSADQLGKLRELLSPYVAAVDAVICAAVVAGHRPPVLVTTEMMQRMRPGSVVVDLAADAGGNAENVVAGSVTKVGEVQVWGGQQVTSSMPGVASELYAGNVTALLNRLGSGAPDLTDEILGAVTLTHAGEIVHEPTRLAIEGPRPETPIAAPEPKDDVPAYLHEAPEADLPDEVVEAPALAAPDEFLEEDLLPDDGPVLVEADALDAEQ